MYRKEIEEKLKAAGQKDIGIIYNKDDNLGVYCELKGGFLTDYTGHRVDRKKDIWGYISYDFTGGYPKPVRVKFDN